MLARDYLYSALGFNLSIYRLAWIVSEEGKLGGKGVRN